MAQFSVERQQSLFNADLHEVNLLARSDGYPIKEDNYLHVGEYTSKNRIKVSGYETVFFNTFQYGKETDVWDEATSGDADATHNLNSNVVALRVGGTAGASVFRQTRNVQRYIPGRQSQLTFAIRMEAPVTGIRRRFGLFEENNGFFFEDAGVEVEGIPQYNVVIRSKTSGSVVETRVPREAWNGDKLDGTGQSGIIADSTKQQLISFAYEWYGAGQVRVLWNIDGRSILIHTFNHSNILPDVWCSTPFLPIRMELECISTIGGDHYMYQGSNSLVSEGDGGYGHKIGIAENVSSPITGTTTTAANLWYPILSLRLKPDDLKGVVLPTFFQVATADNTNLFYRVVRNAVIPTEVVAGQDGPQPWLNQRDADAFTQYQTYISPVAIADNSDQGVSIDSGFITGSGGDRISVDPNTQYQLGRTGMGTVSDTYTILCATTGSNKSVLAAMTWIEQR
jgi:hypothetical protein|tara:strand:- start:14423 stop:15781 length:1359 start_codon:yes stop_codon:yes gene_type:complete